MTKIVMMKVSDILAQARSSCDFQDFNGDVESWRELINEKANDSGFWDLVDSIQERGFSPQSAIGFNNGYYISEGHHRLTAAILLGLDEIPVAPFGTRWRDENGRVISAHHEGPWDNRTLIEYV